ncbi:hypothetical protein SFRURICE_017175, partial [Spodoptera frugiperda]
MQHIHSSKVQIKVYIVLITIVRHTTLNKKNTVHRKFRRLHNVAASANAAHDEDCLCDSKLSAKREARGVVDVKFVGELRRSLYVEMLRDVAAFALAAHNERSLCDSKLVELFSINL